MCTGDVKRGRIFDGLPALTLSAKSPEPREKLRWNFGAVNKITLGTFLGQNHILSKVSAHVQMTHFSTWPHFTNLLQYLAFEIDFLVYEVGDMLRPWNFLENVFWQRKLIGEAIVSFCWRHQKLVSGVYSTRQSRDLANDITNCHFFVREFPGTSFNWDTRDVAYVPLYTHNILEKGEGWKLWYSFESLALRYSPKNLPHLPKVSTYFTWWNWYFCLCIRRVTEVLK